MLLDMEGGGCAAADAALDDDGSPSAADAGAGSLLEAAAGVSFIDCPVRTTPANRFNRCSFGYYSSINSLLINDC
jgi:hypothetical protein